MPDADEIRAAVEQRFAQVARSPGQEKKFPVGPASAKKLGYNPQEIDALPISVTESFCGVGIPLGLGEVRAGQTVLVLGSGPGQPARRSPGGTDRQGGRRRSVPGDGREGPPQRRIAGPAQRRVRERRDRNVASAGGDGWWANTSAASGSNGQPVSEEAIRLCAYQRWEAAGKPGGDGLKFWLEAEQELSHAK